MNQQVIHINKQIEKENESKGSSEVKNTGNERKNITRVTQEQVR